VTRMLKLSVARRAIMRSARNSADRKSESAMHDRPRTQFLAHPREKRRRVCCSGRKAARFFLRQAWTRAEPPADRWRPATNGRDTGARGSASGLRKVSRRSAGRAPAAARAGSAMRPMATFRNQTSSEVHSVRAQGDEQRRNATIQRPHAQLLKASSRLSPGEAT